ncbi:MAG TPA: metalloregulator ArsR/SmtB family transcription factor [Candidatus Eisenbacteria bacterium]|nr:metalloregulator ArsR/SmtB family transcription factor [Candidatus Eisenbacteria bacterium]
MPAKKLKTFFGTLASLTRLSILFSLASAEKTVGQIARELGMEQSIVSHGLRRLSTAGLLSVRKAGRERHYRLQEEKTAHVFALAQTVDLKEPVPFAGLRTPEYMVVIDKRHQFAYFRDLTGRSMDMDVLGKSVYDFIPKFFRAIAKKRFEKAFRADKPIVWKIPSFDEKMKVRWYETKVEPIGGGGGGGGGASAIVISAVALGASKMSRETKRGPS